MPGFIFQSSTQANILALKTLSSARSPGMFESQLTKNLIRAAGQVMCGCFVFPRLPGSKPGASPAAACRERGPLSDSISFQNYPDMRHPEHIGMAAGGVFRAKAGQIDSYAVLAGFPWHRSGQAEHLHFPSGYREGASSTNADPGHARQIA